MFTQFFHGIGGKRETGTPDGRQLAPPMDTHNIRGILRRCWSFEKEYALFSLIITHKHTYIYAGKTFFESRLVKKKTNTKIEP